MYGYSFGAAKSNVWHIWKEDFMLYPSYTPNSEQRSALTAAMYPCLYRKAHK